MPEPRPEPLIFPHGVRFPRADEFPAASEADRERVARANVTTGYLLKEQASHAVAGYFEINMHAPRLWDLFRDLATTVLPEVAAPIIGIKDGEPRLGPYTDRDAAIGIFEPYVELLQHDGFLEFGVMFQHQGRTEEVFVRSSKYVQVWTSRPDDVRTVLHRHGLSEVPHLEFIDEYPRVSMSLQTPDGNARWPEALEGVEAAFADLPRR